MMATVHEGDGEAWKADLPLKRGHRIAYDANRMMDACVNCGASSIEIDDNLAPSCDPVPAGPNREAIMVIRRELLRAGLNVEQLRRHLVSAENSCVGLTRNIRLAEARRRELVTSLAALGDHWEGVPPDIPDPSLIGGQNRPAGGRIGGIGPDTGRLVRM